MNFRDLFSFQKRIYFRLVACILLMAFFSSCQDCTFESDNITFARVQFYHKVSKEAFDDKALDTTFISVRAVNELANIDQSFNGRATIDPNDVDTETNQTLTYNLPLYTSDSRSMFIFTHNDATQSQDTLTFSYQLHLDVSTPDCGVNERIDNLQILNTTFDSAVVIHTTIDLKNNHDVEIYLPF